MQASKFNNSCVQCPRLASFLKDVRKQFPDYYGKPVPAFGDPKAKLCIVGLAPGMHGANATGRPFTGDHAGIILYETLHKYGFANKAESVASNDNLKLKNCRITNAVKCLPPQNRPSGAEIRQCNPYLRDEITQLNPGSVILALGAIAHRSVLRALDLPQFAMQFKHLAEHPLPAELSLIDSYHCSRYNFNTGRLNRNMFEQVFRNIAGLMP